MNKPWWVKAACLLLWVGSANAQSPSAACPPTASHSPALLAEAAQQARNRGFLWRIQRDGQSSYLYGSLHVGKAEWMSPGPAMRLALQQVDTVALEIDLASDEAQLQLQALNSRSQRSIPAALRKRLERLWLAECLPLAQLDSGPVELQATALLVLMGRRQGFDPAYSSEMMLTLYAKASDLPLVSLESLKSQLDLVLTESDAQATEMVSEVLAQVEKPQSRETQKKLISAWARSDLGLLARYQDWCDCVHTDRERADMKKLLDDRNPGLADGIERLHAGGQRVLAAVGALHMTGPLALPRLLAARGFTVERLY
jgi:uncharacterized protein YbaP (TraB family)